MTFLAYRGILFKTAVGDGVSPMRMLLKTDTEDDASTMPLLTPQQLISRLASGR